MKRKMTRPVTVLVALFVVLTASFLYGYTHPVSFDDLQSSVDLNFPSSGVAAYIEQTADAEGKVDTFPVSVELTEEQITELLDILRQYEWSRTLSFLFPSNRTLYHDPEFSIHILFNTSEVLSLSSRANGLYLSFDDRGDCRCKVNDYEGLCKDLIAYLQSVTPAE